MKIKVCGMRDEDNVAELAALKPDYIGFIFYKGSKRDVTWEDLEFIEELDDEIQKVGVFVNETTDEIMRLTSRNDITMFQLHGDESPEQCAELKEMGFQVMKAFSVDSAFDFETTVPYKESVDYFLFDTKGAEYGGNGVTFDWSLLKKYDNEVPFFLSGGIDENMLSELDNLREFNIVGIDVNSKFETGPAMKDIARLKEFISKIRQ
ncbi:MAG: phosphoribosylanthranilate isomerase [Flavobacteriales bacterium]|nr:phosphoribosylanthranilate isomerase [Flavobacteriales bacterium]